MRVSSHCRYSCLALSAVVEQQAWHPVSAALDKHSARGRLTSRRRRAPAPRLGNQPGLSGWADQAHSAGAGQPHLGVITSQQSPHARHINSTPKNFHRRAQRQGHPTGAIPMLITSATHKSLDLTVPSISATAQERVGAGQPWTLQQPGPARGAPSGHSGPAPRPAGCP